MKKVQTFILFGIVLVILSCSSMDSNTSGGQQRMNSNRSSVPYFTGSGGKGMSLGILVLESNGLSDNQAYLPRMVQGCLVSNMSKYSAITVLDRVSLDKVIAETLDPTTLNHSWQIRLIIA